MISTLISVVIVLVILGLVVYLIEQYVPMPHAVPARDPGGDRDRACCSGWRGSP